MKRYVTDTQCLLWSMAEDRRLPKAVRPIFQAADEGRAQILVPSIVLVEAIFLLQRQRVSDVVIRQLMQLSEEADSNFYVTPLDMAVVQALRDFGPTAVPELSDRIIAATARALNLPLLTTDLAIEASGLVTVIN